MIYKNKIIQQQKEKMAKMAGGKVSTDKIVSSNKMKKPLVSSLAQARRAENKGAGVSGQSAAEKVLDKAEDLGTEKPTKLNNPSNTKVRDELYKNMSIKELRKLALTDQNAKKFLTANIAVANKLGV